MGKKKKQNKTYVQSERQATISAEANQNEITKLQVALAQTLGQLEKFRIQNADLEKQLMQAENLLKLKKEQLIQQKQQATKQHQSLEHQLEKLEKKYYDLSHSKLGRLTLQHWANQAKRRHRKRELSESFIVRWLFNRVPMVQEDVSDDVVVSEENEKTESVMAGLSEKEHSVLQQTTAKIMSPEQKHWIEDYLDHIEKIANSNGCRYYQKAPYRIAIVCDEFFYKSINATADYIYLTPENWECELDKGMEALLFVSTWHGLHNEWTGISTSAALKFGNSPQRQSALELLKACREKKIPTVFYTKEDPGNYEVFIDFARECDYICTSAEECVSYYKEDCDRDKVYVIPFGINPQFHNPIGFRVGKKEDKDTILFSGSWMNKYPERCRDLSNIFDGILQSEYRLHIIDRNYPSNPRSMFPDPYFTLSSPALSHDILQKVHKLFDWAVNINSAKGSTTMFANRAFELQANGVLLLSNFSVGMNDLLPMVQIVHQASDVASIVDGLTAEELYERQIAGIRSVMTGHTCFDRMQQMFAPTGLNIAQPIRQILVLTNSLTQMVCENFEHQTYKDKILRQATDVRAEDLNEYDMVAWFDSQAEYHEFYLEDMANGFKYTSCDYITKDAWYEGRTLHEGVEHDYVSCMGSKFRTLFWREAFETAFLLNMSGEYDLENGYSIDRFNYNAAPLKTEIEDSPHRLSVIVPVYNNGRHLYGKCFPSLRRSSLFYKMEIILVDRGSTDAYTLDIECCLERLYSNVRIFRSIDYSGNGFYPCSKGVELATSPYLTFLSPYNEAVCDGYARLLKEVSNQQQDIVMGNMYYYHYVDLFTVNLETKDYYGQITGAMGTDRFGEGFQRAITEFNFESPSVQAMIIRTDFIREKCLRQVPKTNEDSDLFCWQLFYCANHVSLYNFPVFVEYGQVLPTSIVTKNLKWFIKMLMIQQNRVDWLKDNGLLDNYMRLKFASYMKDKILFELSRLPEKEALACAQYAEKMLNVFPACEQNGEDTIIDKFRALCAVGNFKSAVKYIKEVFPDDKVRPMPSLKELLTGGDQTLLLRLEYQREDKVFTFYNRSGKVGSLYAWSILQEIDTKQKICVTQYSYDNAFAFDFSTLNPSIYKVRAFMKSGDKKIAEDAAYIRVDEQGAAIMSAISNVEKVGI